MIWADRVLTSSGQDGGQVLLVMGGRNLHDIRCTLPCAGGIRMHLLVASVSLVAGYLIAVRAMIRFWLGSYMYKRNGLPEGFAPSQEAVNPQSRGMAWMAVGFIFMFLSFNMMVTSISYFAAHQSFSITGETLRMFSLSSSPWLDLAKMITTTSTVVFCHLFTKNQLIGFRGKGFIFRGWQGGRSKATGRALEVAGTLICVITAAVAISITVDFMLGNGTGRPTLMFAPSIIYLSGPVYRAGGDLRRQGRRHRSPLIANPDDIIGSPFVLYLRSFVDDSRRNRSQFRAGQPVLNQFLISGRSQEEQIAAATKSLGRLVAVGQPGEELPYPGAARMYLPPDEWQTPVLRMMDAATLVLLALGPGQSTMWELRQAMERLPAERLVLLVPMSMKEYDEFRNDADRALADSPYDRPLPEYRMRPRQMADPEFKKLMPPRLAPGIQAIIYFQETGSAGAWEPRFVWLDSELNSIWRFSEFRDYLYVALKHGLKPVIARIATSDSTTQRGKRR